MTNTQHEKLDALYWDVLRLRNDVVHSTQDVNDVLIADELDSIAEKLWALWANN